MFELQAPHASARQARRQRGRGVAMGPLDPLAKLDASVAAAVVTLAARAQA
ncbi:MAG: hypothetical protein R3A79_05360 [Nannocystaceae bacterium]